jgi:folate-binding protein YgfZ
MFAPAEYDALRRTAGVLNRSSRGRFRLAGEDRRGYLQGLLTNDIAALGPGTGCYAAMLTANGRMMSDMRVLELGDAILIDLPGQTAPLVLSKLEEFIFSEDVVVADLSQSLAQLGVYGPGSPEILSAALGRLASSGEPSPGAGQLSALNQFDNTRWDLRGAPAFVARSDDFGIDGFEVYVDSAAVDSLERALAEAGALNVSEAAADVCRIEAGRPAFGADMDQDTIPLEAGIEDRAISLTKGCYVGQEIIIRVLHRGHGRVARRLVGIVLEGSPPARGARLMAGGRDAGTITSAARSPALERTIALGYVHRDLVEPGTRLEVAGAEGPQNAVVTRLPFVERHAEPARP